MSHQRMTTAHAIELTSRIIKDDRALVEPLIKLIAGVGGRGDPLDDSTRRAVLLHLYSKTDDCDLHLQEYINRADITESSLLT